MRQNSILRIIILLLISILLGVTPIYAGQETRVKVGYATILCEPITASPILEVSYQYRPNWLKWFAIEPAITGMTSRISQVGRMYIVEPSITGKVYVNNLYIGAGVGYYFNTIAEYFGNQADLDDEVARFGVIGIEMKNTFIELKGVVADLDMETGLPFEPEIERHSRYDNFQILIGQRFKF